MARPSRGTIDQIIGGGAKAEGAVAHTTSSEELVSLRERVDLMVADFGRWESYKAASKEYIEAFTIELNWHRRVRVAVVVGAIALVLFLCVGLVIVLCWAQDIFGPNPGHALTALIAGAIGGSVIISIALVRGAFATLGDRNAGLPMPEHIKEIVDVGKNLFGN